MDTFQEIVDYLYNFLPYYQNKGVKAYRPGLDKMYALCEALGNPQEQHTYIHVAGSNGKGSVSHMLASVFMAANMKVGLYTSPHLFDLRERFKIDGQLIDKQEVISFINENQTLIEGLRPSFFELTVAMAFHFFKMADTDVNIIEVGLGGRLDSTNVITPALSIITNIELEHTQILGDTIEAIAFEKAGIIKSNGNVILGQMKTNARDTITAQAKLKLANVQYAQDLVKIENTVRNAEGLKFECTLKGGKNLSIKLPTWANYQIENAQTAIASLDRLSQIEPYLGVDYWQIQKGLGSFQKATNFRGRFECISTKPIVIADAMHNPAGASKTIEQIVSMDKPIHAVLGFSSDKDFKQMLELFSPNTRFYFCRPNSLRAQSIDVLKSWLDDVGARGYCFSEPWEALNAAKYYAKSTEIILIGGSIFLLAELI